MTWFLAVGHICAAALTSKGYELYLKAKETLSELYLGSGSHNCVPHKVFVALTLNPSMEGRLRARATLHTMALCCVFEVGIRNMG